METIKLDLKSKIAYLIVLLLGFQQFPIIRVGGSLKLYEILAIILLVLNIYTIKHHKQSWFILFTFLFFVVSPLISYLNSVFLIDYPYGFYTHFPNAIGFKFEYYIFPFLQLVYMFFNFSTIYSLYNSTRLYFHFDKLIKASIYIATAISIYSLISMVSIDVVRLLPSFIQNKSPFPHRSYGLSQEPSFYVLYQAWMCLFVTYSKKMFNTNTWRLLVAINVISFIFCFSTMLFGFLFVLILNAFLFNKSFTLKLKLTLAFIVLCIVAYLVISYYNLFDTFEYLFINKIQSFYESPNHTLDSGSYRSYTSGIGLRIFKDHNILGVGVGNSIYYMYIYEFKMGIQSFGETLTESSFPQNCFSSVLSEQGIVGGCFFLIMITIMLFKLWRFKNLSEYSQMFFIGSMFTFVTMLTIAPVYSLFLWGFIALGIGYNKFLIEKENIDL